MDEQGKLEFTHFDQQGNAIMVDVTEKQDTKRIAVAEGSIALGAEAFQRVKEGSVEKGDVLSVARIAGIMGAKRCAELIPLCHVLNLTKLTVDFSWEEKKHKIWVRCTAATTGKTGVEMEALTGVNIALLTIYDMCKAIDKRMEIGQIHLVEKLGGKSGHYYDGFLSQTD